MPTAWVKALAQKHGVDEAVVEGYWNECKEAIRPVAKARGQQHGYGLVVNCVKRKLMRRAIKRRGKR